MASDPPLAFYFCYLESKNPREIVHSFTQTNPGPTSVNIRNSLQVLGDSNLRALTKRLIDTLNDRLFRDQFRFAIKNRTENYPSETAFIVVGIVLRCKPRAAPGFGSLGPTGELLLDRPFGFKGIDNGLDLIAEAWLSSIRGFEAADRALDILRSVGIVRTKVAVTRNAKRSLEQHRAILARSDECEAMLSAMQGQHSILSELRKFNLRDLFNKLIATATDPEFYRALFRAVINHIKAHPYQTIFIVVGLVLILNPVGLAGFGALGPVAGTFFGAN
jgi:hypothetical protein